MHLLMGEDCSFESFLSEQPSPFLAPADSFGPPEGDSRKRNRQETDDDAAAWPARPTLRARRSWSDSALQTVSFDGVSFAPSAGDALHHLLDDEPGEHDAPDLMEGLGAIAGLYGYGDHAEHDSLLGLLARDNIVGGSFSVDIVPVVPPPVPTAPVAVVPSSEEEDGGNFEDHELDSEESGAAAPTARPGMSTTRTRRRASATATCVDGSEEYQVGAREGLSDSGYEDQEEGGAAHAPKPQRRQRQPARSRKAAAVTARKRQPKVRTSSTGAAAPPATAAAATAAAAAAAAASWVGSNVVPLAQPASLAAPSPRGRRPSRSGAAVAVARAVAALSEDVVDAPHAAVAAASATSASRAAAPTPSADVLQAAAAAAAAVTSSSSSSSPANIAAKQEAEPEQLSPPPAVSRASSSSSCAAADVAGRKRLHLDLLKQQVAELLSRQRQLEAGEAEPAATEAAASARKRCSAVRKFLEYRGAVSADRQAWAALLSEAFTLVLPVAHYRASLEAIPADAVLGSGADGSSGGGVKAKTAAAAKDAGTRTLRGIEAVMRDTQAISRLVECINARCQHARPHKRCDVRLVYCVAPGDMMVSSEQVMCHWKLTTDRLTTDGGMPRECTVDGMLCCRFDSASDLMESMEITYDVLGFMHQLRSLSLLPGQPLPLPRMASAPANLGAYNAPPPPPPLQFHHHVGYHHGHPPHPHMQHHRPLPPPPPDVYHHHHHHAVAYAALPPPPPGQQCACCHHPQQALPLHHPQRQQQQQQLLQQPPLLQRLAAAPAGGPGGAVPALVTPTAAGVATAAAAGRVVAARGLNGRVPVVKAEETEAPPLPTSDAFPQTAPAVAVQQQQQEQQPQEQQQEQEQPQQDAEQEDASECDDEDYMEEEGGDGDAVDVPGLKSEESAQTAAQAAANPGNSNKNNDNGNGVQSAAAAAAAVPVSPATAAAAAPPAVVLPATAVRGPVPYGWQQQHAPPPPPPPGWYRCAGKCCAHLPPPPPQQMQQHMYWAPYHAIAKPQEA